MSDKPKRTSTRLYYVIRGEDGQFTAYENKAQVIEHIESGQIEDGQPIYHGHLTRCDVARTMINGVASSVDVVRRK